jgi:hypothetical protein
MNSQRTLNKLEHNLLSMQVMDSEPLFILYADTTRDMPDVSLDMVLESLLKLISLGLSRVMVHEDEGWRYITNISLHDLEKRFQGQSDKEKKEYPKHLNEYYFEITDEGRKEESKEVYSIYYPDNS